MRLWRRAMLPVTCAALQVLGVATGPTAQPGAGAGLAFAALGLTSGAAIAWQGRRFWWVLAYCALAYPAQALLLAPPLPAAMTVLAYQLGRRPGEDGTEGAAGWQRAAALGGALAVGVWGPFLSGEPYWAAPYALILVGAYAGGLTVSARASREESRRRSLLDEQRMQIARELHDVVGHSASAISAQSGAARMALSGGAVADATAALRQIEAASRALLRETRWMVGLLRDAAERPDLGDLEGLLDNARRSGLEIRTTQSADVDHLPTDASHAAYRIVQEALTNALRHGGDGPVEVSVTLDDQLVVRVLSSMAPSYSGAPGSPPDHPGPDASAPVPGHGIQGMEERARAVGGSLRVGPGSSRDWSVEARLPVAVTR